MSFIQNQDIKSAAQLVSAGATAASLPNDDKIYIARAGLADQLSNLLTSGDIFSSAFAIKFGVTTDSTTTGTAAALPAATKGILRLTNSSLVSISTITGQAAGQVFVLTNATGNLITINDNDAANGIRTGTGGPIQLQNNASIIIAYDSTSSRSRIVGGVGSGTGSGSKNYLTTYLGNTGNGDFEFNSTTGWSLFNTTLTSLIPTGSITAGAASVTTFAATSTNKLAGSYSLNTASSAAWAAGQGFITNAFTIDAEDQAKVMTIKYYYSVQSGATNGNFSGTSSNTFAVYIYDVTNSAWIQPAGVYGITQSSGSGYGTATFQTTSNSTQYRLAIICINASAGAISLNWDDFSVGPQTAPIGSPVGDWVSYTPVWTTSGTAPSLGNGTVSGRYRRIGDSVQVEANLTLGSTSTVGTNTTYISLPLPVDQTKIGGSGSFNYGFGNVYDSSTSTNARVGTVQFDYANQRASLYLNATGNFAATTTGWGGAGDQFTISCWYPVAGWSSNVQMSSDTDTRVVAFSAYQSSSQTISTNNTFQKITINAISSDSHGAFSTANNRYIVPVTGWYQFTGSVFLNSTNIVANRYAINLFINGNATDESINRVFTAGVGERMICTFKPVYMNAGDYAELNVFGQGNNSVSTLTTITGLSSTSFAGYRISGPSVIAATESVNCRVYQSASQTGINPNNSNVKINMNIRDFDSHNAFDTSAFRYNVPVSGVYEVKVAIIITGVNTLANLYIPILYRNGSPFQTGGGLYLSAATQSIFLNSSFTVKCVAGDYLEPYLYGQGNNSASTLTSSNGINQTSMTITRVGN